MGGERWTPVSSVRCLTSFNLITNLTAVSWLPGKIWVPGDGVVSPTASPASVCANPTNANYAPYMRP